MEDPDIDPLSCLAAIVANPIFKSFSVEALLSLIVLVVLLLFSALISGSEIAYFSLSPSQFDDPKVHKKGVDNIVQKLLDTPNRLLATILIANNFVNVAIVILSAYIAILLFNFEGYPVLAFLIQVVVITFLILFFGEIMPKIYASQQSLTFARFMARPLRFLLRLLYPVSSVLVHSTKFIEKKKLKKGPRISRSELSEAIEITTEEDIREDERKILQGIVKFGDIDVTEIMKSRTDVTAIDIELPFNEVYKLILEAGFSRIPVYRESIDKIEGMLYIKDLLPHMEEPSDFNWKELLRPAFFVPENKKINDLLKEFQEKKIHFAIVVDEYGGTSGIVTLEDIIEEILGEISDEFDTHEDETVFSKVDENTYLFEAKTTINDFCKILEIDDEVFDEVKGEADSLGGLILELKGEIPEQGEKITHKNFEFCIKSVDNRRIKEILIIINPKEKS